MSVIDGLPSQHPFWRINHSMDQRKKAAGCVPHHMNCAAVVVPIPPSAATCMGATCTNVYTKKRSNLSPESGALYVFLRQ